jgi:hypothetical protein
LYDKNKLLAEKILTKLHADLCPQCRKKIEERIIDLAKETASEITEGLGI